MSAIDYAAMARAYPRQKAALTRAVNSGDPAKVLAAATAAVTFWNTHGGAWPDDWARWQRALDDAYGWRNPHRLEDL